MTADSLSELASEDPQTLERKARQAREDVDRTLDELENRLSVKRRIKGASSAVAQVAAGTFQGLSPPITTLIRIDHTHVLAAFRRFRRSMHPTRKHALIANVCLALDIHARLEEEIFYPALFSQGGDAKTLQKSIADHDEMRALSERLQTLQPADPQADELFYELVRTVLHHVADEETTLLPLAETRLPDQLRELGWKMNMRRIALLKPHAVDAATSTAMTFPMLTAAMIGGFLAASWLLARAAFRARDTISK